MNSGEGTGDDGLLAAHLTVIDAEHDGAATSIGHADGHLDDEADCIVHAAGIPLLEVQILGFEVIGDRSVQLPQ
jgi:hypothetical protein